MLTGKNLIGCVPSDSTDGRFSAGGALADFDEASVAHVDRAVAAAESASHEYRRLSADARAGFLDCIADQLERLSDLLDVAHIETALTSERLAGERARTVGQLRMFAN